MTSVSHMQLVPTIALVLTGILLLRKAALFIIDCLAPRLELRGTLPQPSTEVRAKALAEDEDLSRFVAGFRAAPAPSVPSKPSTAAVSTPKPEVVNGNNQTQHGPLQDFFDWAPGHLTELRSRVGSIGWSAAGSADTVSVRKLMREVGVQIQSLKSRAGLPELRPAWQMASALDGLLKQLTDRVGNITPSTVRTIAGAIGVLGRLCAPGLRADLATNPPIRILVVDDDAVTRFTLAAAVNKVFDQPEFARHGEAALTLAARQAYDVVFLDVKMPGMDGFEVCSRIHETEVNRSTPVVFVTGVNDFDSRTSSVISGGSELIAKPFLTFEIAVKALTLVLQSRFKTGDRPIEVPNPSVNSGTPENAPREDTAAPAVGALTPGTADPPAPVRNPPAEINAFLDQARRMPQPRRVSVDCAGVLNPDVPQSGLVVLPRPAVASPLLPKPSAALAEMRNELGLIGQTVDQAERREKLVVLHLRIQSLTRQLYLPELRPAFQLCSALQGLLKKLQDKPASAVGSSLAAVSSAVEVLGDLCAKGVKPDLADTPAISILVVDDEPLTRRAIVGALQTKFLKPVGREQGEDALALAREKTFDVIFLDVEMPGMNGFEVCAKIRETGANRATPVVFVTSHADDKTRDESARCGGTDFVVKPFLVVEINVKALTFALRRRLQMPAPPDLS